MVTKKTKNCKLRVFEAFAGIGAQITALKRLGVDYEVVGISDWFVDAIICYDALHNDGTNVEIPDREKQLEELSRFEFSRDSMKPIKNLRSIDAETLSNLYRAHKRSKNLGSITKVNGTNMPECDLLVYSFPCQDLSTGGNNYGMRKDSGTRSSLLWEVERILIELSELNRLPQYLLLENVKTIKADTHKKDLDLWLAFLTSIGYKNENCMVLNAKDFGVPQDRERAFIFSHLGDEPLNIARYIEANKKPRKYNIADFIKNDYTVEELKNEADIAQLNNTPSREAMWKINGKEISDNLIVRTITCNMDRTHTSALFRYTGPKGETYRRLTIREAFLLMGFTEEEYKKTLHLGYSYRKMNKLIGNSIVVNVLTAIFDAIIRADNRRWTKLKRTEETIDE
jgi:DNA (cytosine-5)-methyltransferase 1